MPLSWKDLQFAFEARHRMRVEKNLETWHIFCDPAGILISIDQIQRPVLPSIFYNKCFRFFLHIFRAVADHGAVGPLMFFLNRWFEYNKNMLGDFMHKYTHIQ